MKTLVLIAAVTFAIIAAGLTCGGVAQASTVGDGSGDYVYAFPRNPLASTVRNMMLHGCVPNSYYNDLRHWICPDAPPYVYGN